MIALGIDPGTAICGYGLVEMQGHRLRPLHYGALTTSPKDRPEIRLKYLYDGLLEIIEQFKPEVMGVEQLFFNRNVTTAIAVGQARGVILLSAAVHNLPIAEYTPLQVKQSVVGYGKATKDQVIFMTQKLLGLSQKPHPDDVADALAIAICTLHSRDRKIAWEKLI